MKRCARVPTGVVLCLCLLVSGRASAQTSTDTGLSPRQLMIRLTNAAGTGTGVSNIGEAIADLIGLEVSTAPLGSSAGGFTFTFDPQTRAFSRAAVSFGPMFGERAITTGEGRANVGINYIHTTYDTMDGYHLRGAGLPTAVLFVGGNQLYTGTAKLTATTDTMVFFSNVALNQRFDLGIAVPYVRLRLQGTHTIADTLAQGSASAEGLGDIALRAKMHVISLKQGNVALGVDARVPTGDKEALLGAGVTRTLISGIWSTTYGKFSPHAQAGFEVWSDPFQVFDPLERATVDAGRNGVVGNAGVEWAATDRLTVNGEWMGRKINNGGRLSYRSLPFRGNPFGITNASIATVAAKGLSESSAAFGVKWNFAGAGLVNASVLTSLDSSGLRDKFTPILGVDWGF